MGEPIDPTRAELRRELRRFRSDHEPLLEERLAGYSTLVDLLGAGNAERAWESMLRLRADYGSDPTSVIGAYFWTAGWGDDNPILDRRLDRYHERFAVDTRTARRRGDQGADQLALIIRDRVELARPWAVLSLFQSGPTVQLVVDFHLAAESWRPPVISHNGQALPLAPFAVGPDPYEPNRLWSRVVLPKAHIGTGVTYTDVMLRYRVLWEMPIWPTWQLTSWVADARIMTRLRTFRERAVEITLEWWAHDSPASTEDLASDEGVWVGRATANTTAGRRRAGA